MTARLNDHQRPTDRQTLTAAVTSERRQDCSSTITLTRRWTRQVHSGLTEPHPRPQTTSRMTARWVTKETHPRPTDRRMSTEATSSATRRGGSSALARTQHQDNEEKQSTVAAALWTQTEASTPIYLQPHHSTVHAHPRASDPVTRTVAVTSKIRHERSSSIAQTRRQDNEGTLQPAAASCWTDTAASTPSRPLQCRSTATSTR